MKFGEIYRYYYKRQENSYLFTRHPSWLITINGQGSSGKTTLCQKLEAEGVGIEFNMYKTRDRFQREIYDKLQRTQEEMNAEVFGMPSLVWQALEFHWHVKPLLNAGHTMILDHYLGDFIADMLPDLQDLKAFETYVTSIQLPWFHKTISFYLDMDYDTYIERHTSRKHRLKKSTEIARKNFVPEKYFDDRRKRYRKLVELGYLFEIDARQNIDTIFSEVEVITKREFNQRKQHFYYDTQVDPQS